MRSTLLLSFALVAQLFLGGNVPTHADDAPRKEPDQAAPAGRKVVVLKGEFRSPGTYDWHAGLTLTGAIGLAGGFADQRIIHIHRDGKDTAIRYMDVAKKLIADPILEPGDVIELP